MNLQKLKKRLYYEFNLKKQADDLGLEVWQTPSFLFIVMGAVIITAMSLIAHSAMLEDYPQALVLTECGVVIVLFTIGNFIIRVVEEVAKANKMKSEFVSIASHQLKTPISEINWQIELLLSKFSQGLSEKQSQLIHDISNSSMKMSRLVNDLLDVAHIEQGKLALAKDQFDLCILIQETVERYRVLAEASSVDVNVSCSVKKIEVVADKRRIAVVLDNLLSNAIKYIIKSGKVEILITPEDTFVQVCIRDNGMGISRQDSVGIFQKFYRGAGALKTKVDGTGLGLYIAKNIVEQTGGKLWFHSEEQKGSEFYFTLPIIK